MFSCSVTGVNWVDAKTNGLPWSVALPPPPAEGPAVEHAVTRSSAAAESARVRAERPIRHLPPGSIVATVLLRSRAAGRVRAFLTVPLSRDFLSQTRARPVIRP